jgi:hypothetical protein
MMAMYNYRMRKFSIELDIYQHMNMEDIRAHIICAVDKYREINPAQPGMVVCGYEKCSATIKEGWATREKEIV